MDLGVVQLNCTQNKGLVVPSIIKIDWRNMESIKRRSDTGSRSVVDYENEEALRRALTEDQLVQDGDCSHATVERVSPGQKLDWVLSSLDLETSEVQSMQQELQRLLVLKSYLVLDAEREEAFERITALAARIFDVPIALVSMVDLGRQWFMSNHGLGDVRETPRQYAFCAHTILSKRDCLIVPDATKDFRFRDNPFVTGPAHVRFYAGAALVSPEGYKLGTFCLVDKTERPDGLSEDQMATLRDLADMTVKVMVDRRFQLECRDDPTQLIAHTAHDLITPLTGVQLSLSLLQDDSDLKEKLSEAQWELLTTATSCSDLMIRICHTSLESLRTDTIGSGDDLVPLTPSAPITNMKDLVKNLLMIMDPLPKQVPLIITLDPKVPDRIFSDDLKLFRSCLNLISTAAARTRSGKVHLKIHLKNSNKESAQAGTSVDGPKIVFECEDTGPDISSDEYQYLYQPTRADDGNVRLGLSSVAALISSLDGEYGFRPRSIAEDGSDVLDSRLRRVQGSVFWFSVPLYPIPETSQLSQGRISPSSLKRYYSLYPTSTILRRKTPIIPKEVLIRTGSGISIASSGKGRLPVFSPDVCMNAVFEPAMEEAGVRILRASEDSVSYRKRSAEHLSFSSESIPFQQQVVSRRTKRVLIVEDSLVVRKSLSNALRKLGFEVTQAVNGMEGLKELKSELFDLVMCDFLMPVMDGLDCVKQYRAWEKENRPSYCQYIVGISAHVSVEDSRQGIEAGMDDFRPKPITMKILTELQESDSVIQRSKHLDQLTEIDDRDLVDSDVIDGACARAVSAAACIADTGCAPAAKRFQTGSESLHAGPVCLLAMDTAEQKSGLWQATLEATGWRLIVVNDSQTALQFLETRNWDLVLIDEDMVQLAGSSVIQRFRHWEEKNRVNRQRNIFLLIEGEIPAPWDQTSRSQAPSGFDGILKRPIAWDELEYVIRRGEKNGILDIVVNKKDR